MKINDNQEIFMEVRFGDLKLLSGITTPIVL